MEYGRDLSRPPGTRERRAPPLRSWRLGRILAVDPAQGRVEAGVVSLLQRGRVELRRLLPVSGEVDQARDDHAWVRAAQRPLVARVQVEQEGDRLRYPGQLVLGALELQDAGVRLGRGVGDADLVGHPA